MTISKEIEYMVHDDTVPKWEDLTEDEKRKLDELDQTPEMIAFDKKMKEKYGF